MMAPLRPSPDNRLMALERAGVRRYAFIASVVALGGCVEFLGALPGANARPRIAIAQGPPSKTRSTNAVFRLRAGAATTWCRRDDGGFRRCGSKVVYTGLRPGRHRFTVKARGRYGTTYARWSWTIEASAARPFTRLVFADDFDGTHLDQRYWAPYNSVGSGGHGLRRASAVSLDGHGHLVITAAMVGGQLISGGLANRQNYTYGRFEFRVRTEPDPTATMSGVVLTWPESGRWPLDGETDIYETGVAINSRSPFYSYVHYGATNNDHSFRHGADGAQWHTLAMEWTPTAIRIYRDGGLVWTLTDPAAIPHVAHHLCIQLDTTADRALSVPVRIYVDYVRIYR